MMIYKIIKKYKIQIKQASKTSKEIKAWLEESKQVENDVKSTLNEKEVKCAKLNQEIERLKKEVEESNIKLNISLKFERSSENTKNIIDI